MADKDLGDALDELEGLKDKQFRFLGIRMTPTTIGAAIALLGSVVGILYTGFVMYQKIEEVAGLDVGAFEQRMEIIETKLDEAIDYTRDIKSGLRDDILAIEKQVDRTEDMVRQSEEKVREIVQNAEERFENKRDALQNDYDEKASQLRDTTDRKIKDVEDRLNNKLQRALDNPLAN
jgi:Skp family chaperone for outer membrane proteins